MASEKTPKALLDSIKFWTVELKDGSFKECKINHKKYIDFLQSCGFRRYDQGHDYFFIRIKSNVIEEVSRNLIKDEVIQFIEDLPDEYLKKEGMKKEYLLGKFYSSPQTYFNDTKLSMLKPEPNLELNQDTKTEAYIYYKNGYVKCTATGYELLEYSTLRKLIWKNQIKDRNFMKDSPEGMFYKFVYNIANKDAERFLSVQTLIGYSMHSFFDTKRKAINFTDSTISEMPEGRTGKTLLGQGIAKVKNLCEISGKDFKPREDKHKYSNCSIDTQIVFLNDIRKNFDIENLFNDISDHITVDKKNQTPFTINAKILISSNSTFMVDGASAKDRIVEFEFSDHYSNIYSPYNEFKTWFFTEWDVKEWFHFDNFMVNCISKYLEHGIKEAENINLLERKRIEQTNPDFAEWMDEQIKEGFIYQNFDFDKKELHDRFLYAYPDYSDHKFFKLQKNFTSCLKKYAKLSEKLGNNFSDRRANGISYISFGQPQMKRELEDEKTNNYDEFNTELELVTDEKLPF